MGGEPVGAVGRELDLAGEALRTEPLRELGREDLDHHVAPERLLACDEDAAHATAPKLAAQGVGRAEGGLELVAQEVGHDGHREQGQRQAAAGTRAAAAWAMPSIRPQPASGNTPDVSTGRGASEPWQ